MQGVESGTPPNCNVDCVGWMGPVALSCGDASGANGRVQRRNDVRGDVLLYVQLLRAFREHAGPLNPRCSTMRSAAVGRSHVLAHAPCVHCSSRAPREPLTAMITTLSHIAGSCSAPVQSSPAPPQLVLRFASVAHADLPAHNAVTPGLYLLNYAARVLISAGSPALFHIPAQRTSNFRPP